MAQNLEKFDFCIQHHRQYVGVDKRAFFREWLPRVDYRHMPSKSQAPLEKRWESWCYGFLSSSSPLKGHEEDPSRVRVLCHLLGIPLSIWKISDLNVFKQDVLLVYRRKNLLRRDGPPQDTQPQFGWERINRLVSSDSPTFSMTPHDKPRLWHPSMSGEPPIPVFHENDPVVLHIDFPIRARVLVLHRSPSAVVTIIAPSVFVTSDPLGPGAVRLPSTRPRNVPKKAFYVQRPIGIHSLCAVLYDARSLPPWHSAPASRSEHAIRADDNMLADIATHLEELSRSTYEVAALNYEVNAPHRDRVRST